MSNFTDEQIKAAAIEFMAQQLHYRHGTPIGYIRAGLRAEIKAGDPLLIAAVKAMHAAIATLGPISVHEPRQVNSGGKLLTICDACADVEAAVLDTYAHNDPYDAALWPCPTARAHDKETP